MTERIVIRRHSKTFLFRGRHFRIAPLEKGGYRYGYELEALDAPNGPVIVSGQHYRTIAELKADVLTGRYDKAPQDYRTEQPAYFEEAS